MGQETGLIYNISPNGSAGDWYWDVRCDGSIIARGLASTRAGARADAIMAATMVAIWMISSTANAQQSSATPQAITGNPASNPDQELGRRFLIKPENLPPPKTDPVAASRSLLIPYAGQTPRVMEGFTVTPLVWPGINHSARRIWRSSGHAG